MLWLNDGTGHFTDATQTRMPDALVRFSWDLELVDVDNDYDLDIVISCKRCGGGYLFKNDGAGKFSDAGGLPQYTNNYDFEAMDLDEDGFLDLVTINDGEILNEQSANRREHVFRNNQRGRYVDATTLWWPPDQNIGEDDNVAVFLDYDSDGHADFLIGSLSGPDRLMINDGKGHLRVARDVFDGAPTPGTLGMAVADLDGDGRLDVVQAQGEDPKALDERVFFGVGLKPDIAPPSITMVAQPRTSGTCCGPSAHACTIGRALRRISISRTFTSSGRDPCRRASEPVNMKCTVNTSWAVDMPMLLQTRRRHSRSARPTPRGNTACADRQR
jgi:hypothetical protein